MTPASMPLPIAATPPSMQAKPSPADREQRAPVPKRPFAEMLQQRRDAPVATAMPVAAAPAASPADDGQADANANAAADGAPARSLPLRPRLRAAGGMTTCSAPTEAESAATATAAAGGERDDDISDGRGLSAATPAGSEPWRAVAALAAGAVDSRRAVDVPADRAAKTESTDAADLVDAASARPASARSRAGGDDAGSAVVGRAEATTDAASAGPAPVAALGLGETAPVIAAASPQSGRDLAVPGIVAPAAAGGAIEAAPVTAATLALATPVDAPDFAAAFGLQVSMLVKDGVQRAELHLNPADLGPVSIHITLAGSKARIDFGADLAATRHAIEQGLPELAGALRDAGFTLAGGGVSQHAGDRRGSDESSTGHRRHGVKPHSIADEPALVRAARAAGAGGVDLYA